VNTLSISVGLILDDEIESLGPLADSIWRVTYKDLISEAQRLYMIERGYQPSRLRQFIARGDRILVARAGSEIVGYAHVVLIGQGQSKLEKLYVRTDLQRHGIGRLLMTEVEMYALEHNCQALTLRVNKGNEPAISAYRHYGFIEHSEILEDIGGGFFMDDYILIKRLS